MANTKQLMAKHYTIYMYLIPKNKNAVLHTCTMCVCVCMKLQQLVLSPLIIFLYVICFGTSVKHFQMSMVVSGQALVQNITSLNTIKSMKSITTLSLQHFCYFFSNTTICKPPCISPHPKLTNTSIFPCICCISQWKLLYGISTQDSVLMMNTSLQAQPQGDLNNN